MKNKLKKVLYAISFIWLFKLIFKLFKKIVSILLLPFKKLKKLKKKGNRNDLELIHSYYLLAKKEKLNFYAYNNYDDELILELSNQDLKKYTKIKNTKKEEKEIEK